MVAKSVEMKAAKRRRAAGKSNLFTSHMFDGSSLPLKKNLDIAAKLLERLRKSKLFLEIEAGVVGGEEDGVKASASAKLYTTPEDTLKVERQLNSITGARKLFRSGTKTRGYILPENSLLTDQAH
jgi:fructose-bisphosphate aldolase class II